MKAIRRLDKQNENQHFLAVKESFMWGKKELAQGVWLIETITPKNKEIPPFEKFTKLCDYIYINNKIVDNENNVFFEIEFNLINKKQIVIENCILKSTVLFDSRLQSNDWESSIIAKGFCVFDKPSLISEYFKLISQEVDLTKGTNSIGWSDDGQNYRTLGYSTDDVVYTGSLSQTAKFQSKGDKQEYIKRISQIFIDNPLVFAISAYSVSGFFLKHLRNETNQILALTTKSSKGKSLIGKIALSLTRSPTDFGSFDGTNLGLNAYPKQYNDNYLFMDEAQQNSMTSEQRINMLYNITNGTERTKFVKFNDGYKLTQTKQAYRYSVFIAGERSFLAGANISGTGLDVRFCEVILGAENKVFESFIYDKDDENIANETLAEKLNVFIHENYGHMYDDIIKFVKQHNKQITTKYEKTLSVYREKYSESDNLIRRKLRILSFVKVAGEMLGTMFFTDKEISKIAVQNAVDKLEEVIFTNTFSDGKEDVYKSFLSTFSMDFENYFTKKQNNIVIDDTKRLKENWGTIDIQQNHVEIRILPDNFKKICDIKGLDTKLLLSYCIENKILKTDKDKKYTYKVMVDGLGTRINCYCIRYPKSFFDDVVEEKEQPDWN